MSEQDQKSVQDPKRLLMDLAKEVDGETLEDTFLVKTGEQKFNFEIRLPNEEEMNWCYRYVNPSNAVTVATSLKLPGLAISIRRINNMSVDEFFADDWDALPEEDRLVLLSRNEFAKKYFVAEHLMQYLGKRPPTFVHALWKHYESLDARRKSVQDVLKNSSGEGSEKAEKQSSTESSQLGDQSATVPS